MDLLDGLRAFVATARTGSFTQGAKRLGISNRLTSKYVAELEERLGTRLLQRTTRRVSITPMGEKLLTRATDVLDNFDEMFIELVGDSQDVSGIVRISAPVTFGEIYIKDLLGRFAQQHPNLTIDLRLDDAHVDLAKEGIDLAFRVGNLKHSTLKTKRLGYTTALVVASPTYLDQHIRPSSPEDLSRHTCVLDTNSQSSHQWNFKRDNVEYAIEVSSKFLVNSARVAKDLAVSGHGVAYCPAFIVKDDIASGKLERLLPEFETNTYPVSAIYLEGHTLPKAIRALIDFAKIDVRETQILK